MRGIVSICIVSAGVALYGAAPVGRMVSEIAVPLEKVVVPLESVTVDESEIVKVAPDKIPTMQELVSIVRHSKSTADRLAAFDAIWDQDVIFALFFKPGEDGNIEIRKRAIERMAEVELVKYLGARVPLPEVANAAKERLKGLYEDERDFSPSESDSLIRSYVKRTTPRSIK